MSAITEAIITALLGLVIALVLRKILLMHFDAKDNSSEESPTQLLRSTEIDLIEKKQNTRMDKTIPELKKQLKELKKIIKK
jgi:hypothetical protein